SSILLPIYEEQLSQSDRGLCHELVLGVLRRQIFLDRLIDEFTGGRKLDFEIRLSLRLGLFQLLYLDRIPDHAAVNDSVGLAARSRKSSAKGLVNAVLRKVSRERPNLTFADELERISIETSHPRWLLEKWVAQFGISEVERLAAADNEAPPLTFRRIMKGRDISLSCHFRKSNFGDGSLFADSFNADIIR